MVAYKGYELETFPGPPPQREDRARNVPLFPQLDPRKHGMTSRNRNGRIQLPVSESVPSRPLIGGDHRAIVESLLSRVLPSLRDQEIEELTSAYDRLQSLTDRLYSVAAQGLLR